MLKDIGFKNVITVFFVVGAAVGFLVFSGMVKVGKDAQATKGKIVVWGTIPYNIIQPYIDESRTKDIEVIYSVKGKENYERDLVDALAAGEGPDLFIMSHGELLRNADKAFMIPYTSFPKEGFLSTYIDESKIFLTSSGILAIPFFVDPLVLYYNKQLISSSYLVKYPRTWREFADYAKTIKKVDDYGTVTIAGAAMGSYDNVTHAKDILSMLILQKGNPIVGDDPMSGKKKAILSLTKENMDAAKSAFAFYTSFQDRENSHYTWNESLEESRDYFASGDLGLLIDRASQVERMSKRNPNLSFGIAVVPQIEGSQVKKVFGELYGIAISKHTKNLKAAILIASRLAGKDVAKGFVDSFHVAPARLDLLQSIPEDERRSIIYKSAIIADAWVDPDPERSDEVFRNVVRSINAKTVPIYQAIRKMNADLQTILDDTINKVVKGRYDEMKK